MGDKRVIFQVCSKEFLGIIDDNITDSIIRVKLDGNDVLPISKKMIINRKTRKCKLSKLNWISRLFIKKTKIENIIREIDYCCHSNCYKKLNTFDVLKTRIKIFSKEEKQRISYLKEIYNESVFTFNNINICSTLYHKIYCISNDMRKKLITNNFSEENYKLDIEPVSRTEIFNIWMEEFRKNFCDPSPSTSRWFIPFMFDWDIVYNMYHFDITDSSVCKPLSKPSFFKFRKNNFPALKSYKYTTLTKCDVCIEFKSKKIHEKNSYSDSEYQKHVSLVKKERNIYNQKVITSIHNNNNLSIVIDGMTSLIIPHRFPIPKSYSSIVPLKFTPFGLIDHSSNSRMIYIVPPTVSKGSNLVISIVWNYIQEILKKRGSLPPNLYIQSDNAAKESKNKFFLGFLSMLVKKNIFKEVNFSMLPVGHTHIDVDQMFSTIAKKYKRKNVENLHEMIKLIHSAFISEEKRPKVRLIHQIWNFKEWMNEFIEPFSGIQKFHSFKINFDENVTYPSVKYKVYCSDMEWIGKFEVIRHNLEIEPELISIDEYQIDKQICILFDKIIFTSEIAKEKFNNYLKSPGDYGGIYSIPGVNDILSDPFLISDFFPIYDVNISINLIENIVIEENLTMSHPPLPISIQNLRLKEGSIVVAKQENHLGIFKITDLPLFLSAKSWVEVLQYTILPNKSLHVINGSRIRLDKILFTFKLRNGKISDVDYRKYMSKKKSLSPKKTVC